MIEAIRNAKLHMEGDQLAEGNKLEYLKFIQNVRKFIPNFLSHVTPLDYHNYGETMSTEVSGVFINNIDPANDLNMHDAADYSMDVFIGSQQLSWFSKKLHIEPLMVVDVAVQHKPSHETVTNQVFFVHHKTIDLWDRVHAEYPVGLPPILSQDTQLITEVLEYAAHHSEASRGRK